MNMMTQQEEREEQAVPNAAPDMPSDFDASNGEDDFAAAPEASSLFERFSWFRNLSIRGKVHAIFGTFFGIGFAMALVLALGLTELWFRYNTSANVQDAVIAATELNATTGELRYNSARYIFEGEASVAQRQRDSYANAQAQLGEINMIVNSEVPEMRSELETLMGDFAAYNATFSSVVDVQTSEGRNERSVALAYELSDRGDALLADTKSFTDELAVYGEDVKNNGITYFFTMCIIVGLLAMLATVVLLMGLAYLSRDFSRKIVEITGAMTRLAKGDRDFAIAGHDRGDEIGKMVRTLGLFRKAGRQLEIWARERTSKAEEEMRQQLEREREREEEGRRKAALLDEVAQQFERTVGEVVERVATASSELQSTAAHMADKADEARERTSDLSKNMEEANSGATSAAAASDEFALSIGEISRQASSSSELARLATDATVEADTTISALSDSADQVGQIVELIQTIAQRTNLLALNASIEAARGGEAGRGFAVVASEVKELAMQTSRATEQVAEQIRAMQDTTGASVSALRSIAGQVRELETTATSIASAVDQQSVAGQDLARSIDLAARGTEKVAGHIGDVRMLSHSTGEAATQVLSSANELESQAATLNDQVATFLREVRRA